MEYVALFLQPSGQVGLHHVAQTRSAGKVFLFVMLAI